MASSLDKLASNLDDDQCKHLREFDQVFRLMTLHDKSYFPSFRHAKISSIRIFSAYKKTWYFRSQKKKGKIVLSYVFNGVGKTIFSTSEN